MEIYMKILSAYNVSGKTSLSVSHIRRLSKEGKFPRPIQISSIRQGWLETDVDDWIERKRLKSKDVILKNH